MRGSAAAFLLSLGFFTSLGSFGFLLNDEMDLGSAAYNLYRGRLTVDEVPPEFYDYETLDFPPRVTRVNGHGYISESRGTSAIGAVAYPSVVMADALGSVQIAFVLVATVGLFGGLALAMRPAAFRFARPDRRALAAIGALAAAFLAVNLALVRPVPLDPWGAPAAVQLGMAFLSAIGVAAVHRAIVRRSGDRARATLAAVLLAAGTTLALWSTGLKYHGAVVALLGLVVLLRYGGPLGPARHGAAYAVGASRCGCTRRPAG